MIASPVQRDGRRGHRDLFRGPDMDRTRGLRVSQTKTPTSDGWRCVNDVLGGPGRNRTTDTRIFNPLLYQLGRSFRITLRGIHHRRTSLAAERKRALPCHAPESKNGCWIPPVPVSVNEGELVASHPEPLTTTSSGVSACTVHADLQDYPNQHLPRKGSHHSPRHRRHRTIPPGAD